MSKIAINENLCLSDFESRLKRFISFFDINIRKFKHRHSNPRMLGNAKVIILCFVYEKNFYEEFLQLTLVNLLIYVSIHILVIDSSSKLISLCLNIMMYFDHAFFRGPPRYKMITIPN